MEQQQNTQPVFNIEKIYVKDLSLEVPNAPKIFLEQETPEIGVDISSSATPLEGAFFEATLRITVTAKMSGDRTVFLVEASQAGIFRIENVPQAELEPVLAIGCPNILFPYARETISDAITRAGFQPVLLSPVNFEGLYMQRQQQLAQQAGNA